MTEVEASQESARETRTGSIRARLALEAGRMISWEWNIVDDRVVADRGFYDLFGLEPRAITSRDVFGTMHADDLPQVEKDVAAALEKDVDYVTEFRVLLPDGRCRWIGARGAVTARCPAGKPLRMLGINWDKSEQKLQEERLAMIADEMNHRVENSFAIMAALIQIGARSDDDKSRYAERLRSQIQALASAHRLSVEAATKPNDEDAVVAVADTVKTALAAWSSGDRSNAVQVTTAFRTDAYLKPKQTAALAMLAYELATNAIKYGALSTEDGHLTVAVDAAPDGNAVLRWTERTTNPVCPALPVVQEGRGFGGILIEHCSRMLRGSVIRTATRSGMRIEITFPIMQNVAAVRLQAVKAMSGADEVPDRVVAS